MAKSKRLNRTTDMDNALFEALKTPVPEKDTGPDPDDILAGLFDDDDGDEEAEADADALWQQLGKATSLAVPLDEADREKAAQIVQNIGRQTGEHLDFAAALKIALCACTLDDHLLLEAHKMIVRRSDEKE